MMSIKLLEKKGVGRVGVYELAPIATIFVEQHLQLT